MQEVRPDARTWPTAGALLSLALLGACSPAPIASGDPSKMTPGERQAALVRLCGDTTAANVAGAPILEDLAAARAHGLPYSAVEACEGEAFLADMKAGVVTLATLANETPEAKAEMRRALEHKAAVTRARLADVRAAVGR